MELNRRRDDGADRIASRHLSLQRRGRGRPALRVVGPVLTATTSERSARQRAAYRQTQGMFRELLRRFAPEELAAMAQRVEAALGLPLTLDSGERASLVALLTGGRAPDDHERPALELAARTRAFERRRALLAGTYGVSEVARLLGTSRQTPHDRVKSGSLLAVLDRGAWRFPAWQLDPEGPDGVVAGLPQVVRALKVSPLAKVSWFTRPNREFDGRTPIEALKAGKREAVAREAEAVGVF